MVNMSNNSWTTLNVNSIQEYSYSAYGVYKDRFIVLAQRPNQYPKGNLKHITLYDIHTQKHRFLSDEYLPSYFKGTIVNDILYVFARNRPVQRLWLLSPTSKWQEAGAKLLHYPRAVISVKSHIYIFGDNGILHCYDTVDDKFTILSELPEGNVSYTVAAVAGKIYVLGGMNNSYEYDGYYYQDIYSYYGQIKTVHVFDIATRTWLRAPPLPIKNSCAAATTVMDRWIVVSGGQKRYEYESAPINKVYVFDILSHKWSESDVELNPPRAEHKCLTIGTKIVCVGGIDEFNHPKPMQTIEICDIIPEWRYERIKSCIRIRHLLDEGRAFPIIKNTTFKTRRTKNRNNTDMDKLLLEKMVMNVAGTKDIFLQTLFTKKTLDRLDEERVIHALFIELNLDMFRNVLSFI